MSAWDAAIRERYATLNGPQRTIVEAWLSEDLQRSVVDWPGWALFRNLGAPHRNGRLPWPQQQSRAMTTTLRFRILHRDDYTCQYCGARAPDVLLDVDHVVSPSNGGDTHPSNLVTSCTDCNHGKRDMRITNPPNNPHVRALPAACERCDSYKGEQRCKGIEFYCGQSWADLECVGWSGFCCRCGAAYADGQI